MRILIVSPFLPYPLHTGGAVRVFHLLRELARRNSVSLLCFGILTQEAQAALAFCESVYTVPPPRLPRPWSAHARSLAAKEPVTVAFPSEELSACLRDLLRTQRFDLVQIEFLSLAHLSRYVNDGRKILVEHFLTVDQRERQLHLMPWGMKRFYYTLDLYKLRRYEPVAIRRFDGCIAVSARDARVIRSWVPELPVAVVPNGVDTEYFAPDGREDPGSILFLGSFHTDLTNADGVVHFSREIFPRIRHHLPKAQLTVVGSNPPPAVQELARSAGIHVAGSVEDVRPYLARASLVVLPLRAGVGTKIRIFTAMAMQKPVLATPIAAEGVEAVPGEEIVLADGPEAFAEEAIALLLDAPRRSRIGQAARARAVRQYDWRVIGRQLETFYLMMVHQQEAPTRISVTTRSGPAQLDRTHGSMAPSGSVLVRRYRTQFRIPEGIAVTEELIRRHWDLETDLARKLIESTPEHRWETFESSYTAFYRELAEIIEHWGFDAAPTSPQRVADWAHLIGAPPKKVYEIGSGKGKLISSLADLGFECRGTEITRERGEKWVSPRPNLSWGVSDGIHLDRYEPPLTYDVVISDQVIEHLHPDDLLRHLNGVWRILRPGGRCIFDTPHAAFGPSDISRVFGVDRPQGFHLKEYTYQEIVQALHRVGFARIAAVWSFPQRVRRLFGGRPWPFPSTRYLSYLMMLERFLMIIPTRVRRQAAQVCQRLLGFEGIRIVATK